VGRIEGGGGGGRRRGGRREGGMGWRSRKIGKHT